jgi:hypothetical protein
MHSPDTPATSPIRRVLGILESGLGLAFSGFLTLLCFFPGLYVLGNIKSRHTERIAAMWIAWAVVLLLMGLSLRFYGRNIEGATHPVPIYIAQRQRRWPAVLRPFVSLWWLSIAAAMVLGAEWVAREYADLRADQRDVRYVMTAGVLFASAVAANTYLLLATAALTRSPRVLRTVWGRLVIDLSAAFLLPLVKLPW